jgi:hypothetical protein
MNADVVVLALVAFADVTLMVHLRRRQSHHVRMERMMRSLQIHVRSQLSPHSVVAPSKRRMSLRIS